MSKYYKIFLLGVSILFSGVLNGCFRANPHNSASPVSYWQSLSNSNNYPDLGTKINKVIYSKKSDTLFLLNNSGALWQYDLANGSKWQLLPKLNINDQFSQVTYSANNSIIAATQSGLVEKYAIDNKVWSLIPANSLLTLPVSSITSDNNSIYLSNNSTIWQYSSGVWSDITFNSQDDAIKQISVDDMLQSKLLLALTSNGNIWVRNLNNSNWTNLIPLIEQSGQYSDSASQITNISLLTVGNLCYIYFSNDKGHIWRIKYDYTTNNLINIDNVSFNENFIATSLKVDFNNNVYVATSLGNIYLLLANSQNWLNLNAVGNIKPLGVSITSIEIASDYAFFIATEKGQVFAISWQ